MRRFAISRSIGVLLVSTGSAWAAEEPPPLTPPARMPPTADAPAESPAPIPENRPVLVVPGVTAPRSRPRTTLAAPPVVPDPIVEPGGAAPRLIPQPDAPSARVTLPPTLESVPADPRPSANPATSRLANPTPPAAAPRRPSGIFGRLLPAPSFLNGRAAAEPNASVTVEPRSDPAADAALKRRVEKQIREALGDRVRSVDVRVVDRNITIRARAARFWQRRAYVTHSKPCQS